MKIYLIAVGKKMPSWVEEGYKEYEKRLNQDCQLVLVELDTGKRSKKSSPASNKLEDAKSITKAIPKNCHIVVLDVKGKQHSTESLAGRLESWLQMGKDVALIVGGADGLDESIISLANEKWSLSALTFPHPLVRVIIAEQLYRAWSFANNHPYHRE